MTTTISKFPSYATLLAQGSNTYTPQTNAIRTQFEDGSVKQASYRRRLMVKRNVSYQLCSAHDFENFRTWVTCELKNGIRWFIWKDPVKELTSSNGDLRCRIVGGDVKYTAYDTAQKYWQADFTLEHFETVGGDCCA